MDRWLVRPWPGLPLAVLALAAALALTVELARPPQALLLGLLAGPVRTAARSGLGLVGGSGTWVESLVVDGLLPGIGQVLAFIPLVALLAVALGVLELSGLQARHVAALGVLTRSWGLPARSLAPLVAGFGCNVPALVCAGRLPTRHERAITALLVPYVTCSARLPVYLFLAAALFPGVAGAVVGGLYVGSVALVLGGGWLYSRVVAPRSVPGPGGRAPDPSRLPPYRLDRGLVVEVGHRALVRVRDLVRGVLAVVLAAVLVLWLLGAVPVRGAGGFAHVAPEDSLLAALGATVAPLLRPVGLDSWVVATALAAGLVAKEVVVASLAQAAGATGVVAVLAGSSGGHPQAAGLALLVLVLTYTACVPALAAQRASLTGRQVLAGAGLQALIAWVLAVAVFWGGRAAGL